MSGHHRIKDGYICTADNIVRVVEILDRERPDVVISSVIGNHKDLLAMHDVVGKWSKDNQARMVFVSSINVFDGDLSTPVDENTMPVPESEYGKFKFDCEKLLQEILKDNVIILRPSAVWADQCERLDRLKDCSLKKKEMETYPGDMISLTLASQIGEYTRHILDNNLRGIFHIGTEDMVDYHAFEKMVCDGLEIDYPRFKCIEMGATCYQAFLPSVREIPQNMRKTVADVLDAIIRPDNA